MNLIHALTRTRSIPDLVITLFLFAAAALFIWLALGPTDPDPGPALSREDAQRQLEQIRQMSAKLDQVKAAGDDPAARERAWAEYHAAFQAWTALSEEQNAARTRRNREARYKWGLYAALAALFGARSLFHTLRDRSNRGTQANHAAPH
jgi:hypothetical protein